MIRHTQLTSEACLLGGGMGGFPPTLTEMRMS